MFRVLLTWMRQLFPQIALWAAFLFLLLLLSGAVILWRPFSQHPQIDIVSGLFGALTGALFTFLLAWVAWRQLTNISNTASADFILRFKRDFFRGKTRTIVTLLGNDWLKFVERYDDGKEAEIPFFRIDKAAINASGLPGKIKERLVEYEAYTAYEIDDLLLGHFEDLALLLNAGTLDMKMIDKMFGWYIKLAWENGEIRKYIT